MWWLGGSGFAVRAGDVLVMIDPVLSLMGEGRRISELGRELISQPPLLATEVREVDLVLITRAEGCHLGPETLRELSRTKAVYVCPRRGASTLASLGIESSRIELAESEVEIERRDAKVIPTVARLTIEQDGCGYILEMGGKRIFHPGETIVLPDMLEIEGVDVLIAPIGARQPGVEGSARLANALRARWVVPCHYWTYTDDETWGMLNPRQLIEHVEGGEKRVRVLDQGERFDLKD